MTMGSGGFAVRPYTSTAEMHATRASFQTQTRRAMNPGPGLHMRRRLGRFGAPGHPETCVIMTGKSPKMPYSFVGRRAWVAARQFARRDEDDRDPTVSVIRRVSIQTHTHRGFPHEPRREHRVEHRVERSDFPRWLFSDSNPHIPSRRADLRARRRSRCSAASP